MPWQAPLLPPMQNSPFEQYATLARVTGAETTEYATRRTARARKKTLRYPTLSAEIMVISPGASESRREPF